jgi:hypothetical protein
MRPTLSLIQSGMNVILEVLSSNLSLDTSYFDWCVSPFSSVPLANTVIIYLVGQDSFVLYPFQFIVHEASCLSTLYTNMDATALWSNPLALQKTVGRAIAEAVSRWLSTAAARVQSRVCTSGICGGQSGVGAGFLRVLRFPLPFIQPNSPSSQSPGPGTIGR